jgi:hypothetical protein
MAQHEVNEEYRQQHQQAHQPQPQSQVKDNIANAPRNVIELKPTLTLGSEQKEHFEMSGKKINNMKMILILILVLLVLGLVYVLYKNYGSKSPSSFTPELNIESSFPSSVTSSRVFYF